MASAVPLSEPQVLAHTKRRLFPDAEESNTYSVVDTIRELNPENPTLSRAIFQTYEVPRWLLRLPDGMTDPPWWVPEEYDGEPVLKCQRCSEDVLAGEIITPSGFNESEQDQFCRDCWRRFHRLLEMTLAIVRFDRTEHNHYRSS